MLSATLTVRGKSSSLKPRLMGSAVRTTCGAAASVAKARVRSEASRIAREILGWTEWLWYHYGSASDAGWSSPVARWAHNPKVAGSNPAPATTSPLEPDV